LRKLDIIEKFVDTGKLGSTYQSNKICIDILLVKAAYVDQICLQTALGRLLGVSITLSKKLNC